MCFRDGWTKSPRHPHAVKTSWKCAYHSKTEHPDSSRYMCSTAIVHSTDPDRYVDYATSNGLQIRSRNNGRTCAR